MDIISLFERPMEAKEAQHEIDGVVIHDSFAAREEAVRRYSFAVPCVEAVKMLVSMSPLLEVGAGSGFWAKLVKDAGGDVVATDLGKQRTYSKLWGCEDVVQMGAVEAVKVHPDRNVFVCWPTYDSGWAADMAKEIAPGRSLAYIGEGRGGCTADDRFFDVLDSEYDEVGSLRIPRWDGIRDGMEIYTRRWPG